MRIFIYYISSLILTAQACKQTLAFGGSDQSDTVLYAESYLCDYTSASV